MDDATSLDALLPSPQGPQSVPPIMPTPSHVPAAHTMMAPSYKPSIPMMRFAFSNLSMYISFFIAAAVISLSMPRNMILQYFPNAYTSGGVVSWVGAGVLGGAAVIIANVVNAFLNSLIGGM